MVLILVAGGIFGRLWFPDLNGVTQRVAYFGIYIWMLVIVREILKVNAENLRDSSAEYFQNHGISVAEMQDATVIDTPLQIERS